MDMTFAGRRIPLAAGSARACVAGGAPLDVTLSSTPIEGSGTAQLRFSDAAFYIDSGVRHPHRKRERTATGQSRTVIVTTYSANATARRLPVGEAVPTAGLKPGVYVLKVEFSYRRIPSSGGRSTTPSTITRTLIAKFRVC